MEAGGKNAGKWQQAHATHSLCISHFVRVVVHDFYLLYFFPLFFCLSGENVASFFNVNEKNENLLESPSTAAAAAKKG